MTRQLLNRTRPFATRSWLLACLGIPLLAESAAQSLYMPRAVTQAYKRGTRSPDGRPGSKYWQNRARYSITVTALPSKFGEIAFQLLPESPVRQMRQEPMYTTRESDGSIAI